MLKQRVITAVLLLPLVLAAIVLTPPWLFAVVVAFALLLMAREYGMLCGFDEVERIAFALVVIAGFVVATVDWRFAAEIRRVLITGAAALWLAAPIWLATRTVLAPAVKLLFGFFVLTGAGAALLAMKLIALDGRWVLAAFVIVWAADIGGYAFGRLFGRHKLAPGISPGKTWEGFAGGVLLVLLAGFLGARWLVESDMIAAWMVLLAAIAVLSVVGDLVESLLKRQAGVKDSGQLLPGHGGMLDRLDSLLAVAPVFLFTCAQIGIFGELSGVGR